MFLWFFPNHGHWYGFHIVDRKEDQNDLAYSLYIHLPQAPEILFYDFMCGLQEHCLIEKLVVLRALDFIMIFSTVTVTYAFLYTVLKT